MKQTTRAIAAFFLVTVSASSVPCAHAAPCVQVRTTTVTTPAESPVVAFAKTIKSFRTQVREAIVNNDLALAETLAKRAYDYSLRHGLVAEDALAWQHEIGLIQTAREQHGDAASTFDSELHKQQSVYAQTPALTELTLNDLAQSYERTREFDRAFDAYSQQLAILQGIYGCEHIALAETYIDLGRTSYRRDDLKASINFYQKAISLLNQDSEGNRVMLSQAERELSRSTAKLASANLVFY